MSQLPDNANGHAAERTSIRRRVKQLYEWFNQEQWSQCFGMIDPKLRDGGRVDAKSYIASLRDFQKSYGSIRTWYTRISLHMGARNNKRDDRPFAFVYMVWQDSRDEFHMFRERWVKDGGRWYTRVVGLVANRAAGAMTGDVPR
jgi:hypothetical protein